MSGAAAGLVRTVVAASVGAGLVGAWRQHREARSGPGATAPATGTDQRGLAVWVPTAPRTRAGQVAVMLWSAPLTALGFAVALAGGAVPRHDRERRCWVATGVRGPSRAVLGAVGAAANTIGRVVLVTGTAPGDVLLDHEAVHVRQAERLGPALPLAYAWLAARHGYAANPLERAARLGAGRAAAVRAARGAR